MISRRQFLQVGTVATAGFFLPQRLFAQRQSPEAAWSTYEALHPGGPSAPEAILDPLTLSKYETRVIIPPAMPAAGEVTLPDGRTADYYEIAVRQFTQQILPPSAGLPPTTVWSYGAANDPLTYNYPAFTIEAQVGKPVQVKWINGLVDANGGYRPHLLWVDQTVHWANPPGPPDMEGMSQAPYVGPVPMVTHVHGAHTHEESDGYAEAWYLPAANNIPSGYFHAGSAYDQFKHKFAARSGTSWDPGSATFEYPNDQRATTLWYHDHTLGMTRLNVYAGPAGFYLIRGGSADLAAGVLPGPAPTVGSDPFGTFYEIPLAIQDRSFGQSGALFYPTNRAFFEALEPDQLRIPFAHDRACDGLASDIAPIWNPEFFGNTMVVNGRTWPYLPVERRRYRLRLLNGCNSRFLMLKIVAGDPAVRPATATLPFWQIGAEGGFLPAPVQLDRLLMAPAERADVIVDFASVPEGTNLYLINEGPDEPFGGGVPGVDFPYADPQTTGQVLQFQVIAAAGSDASTPPDSLVLPAYVPLAAATITRQVSLNEEDSKTVRVITDEHGNILLACEDPNATPFGPTEALLGTMENGMPMPMMWMDTITETPGVGDTEVWEIYNFTMDAHPIHVHQVMFEVVNRQSLETDMTGMVVMPVNLLGNPIAPEPWESAQKDTVIAYPGQVTRIRARFDLPGLYVWHCHIVEHEDNEMMRPYRVVHRVALPLVSKAGSE